MDCVAFLKHLVLDCQLGSGFFQLGSFKGVYEFLGMFLLFAFGLKPLWSYWFCSGLIRFLFDFRGKSRELDYGFCSKNDLDGKCGLLRMSKEGSEEPLIEENSEKSNLYPDSDEQCDFDTNVDDDNDDKEFIEELDCEFDVSALRKLVKSERRSANEALAELEKERAAAATAAEEAMAMILRLQNEKSLIEMESTQYRRLAEEKQIHDQEVIRSLRWLLWRHEAELEDDLESSGLKPKKLLHEFEEAEATSLPNTEDDLDDMLCRSIDF